MTMLNVVGYMDIIVKSTLFYKILMLIVSAKLHETFESQFHGCFNLYMH